MRLSRDDYFRPGTSLDRRRVPLRSRTGARATMAAVLVVATVSLAQAQADKWVEGPNAGILAVHAALLPNGKVLFFGGSQNDPDKPWGIDATSIYDPATNSVKRIASPPTDLFCSAHAQLADGRIAVVGGTTAYGTDHRGMNHFLGTRTLWLYDFRTNKWSRGPLMNTQQGRQVGGGRWYPSVVTLWDGAILTLAGHPADTQDTRHHNNDIEVWNGLSRDPWRRIGKSMVSEALEWYYPRTFSLPDTTVMIANPLQSRTQAYASWSNTWYDIGPPVVSDHDNPYGGYDTTGVLLPLEHSSNFAASVLVAGGKTPFRRDLAPSARQDWYAVPRTPFPGRADALPLRKTSTAVVLPTGEVAVVGGVGANDQDATGVKEAELFDPRTNKWSIGAPATYARNYHSVALLIPDGRVWVAGSNINKIESEDKFHIDRRRLEIELYQPWYFERTDRPVITSAPASIYPVHRFSVSADTAISKVTLVRAGTATHAFNFDQRHVALRTSAAATTVTVTGPPWGVAPPGYYMLFALNAAGVPSEAKMVKVETYAAFQHLVDAHKLGGDFDGDGKKDILVQSAWGIGLWTMRDGALRSLMLAPNGTAFGGWVFDSNVDQIVTIGNFNKDKQDDLFVTNGGEAAILTFDGTTLTTLWRSGTGDLLSPPTFFPRSDRVVATGDFSIDGQDELLVANEKGIKLLRLQKSSSPCPLPYAPCAGSVLTVVTSIRNGSSAGEWVVDTTSNLFGQTGDFNGDNRADMLIRSDWGLGILHTRERDAELTTLMLAPSGTRFGKWLFNALEDRIAGVGNFNRSVGDEILITSGWGVGVLALQGSSLTSLALARNGTVFPTRDGRPAWAFKSASDEIVGVGHFNLDGKADVLVRHPFFGLGIFHLTPSNSSFETLIKGGRDKIFGEWRSSTIVDQFLGLRDLTGSLADELIVKSPWGIGVLRYRVQEEDPQGRPGELTTVTLAPSGTRFWTLDGKGAWLFSIDDQFGVYRNIY